MQPAHPSAARLDLIDALRGFAIVSIMLLHNIEHFDLYFQPAGLPAWLKALDSMAWDSAFFLFSGKSYAIFALLFGLTFHLQYHARELRGQDFRPRFAWRMALLLGFGLLNSMFYEGDILAIYAVLGLVLIPVARLPSRTTLVLAGVLLLQPGAWLELAAALPQPAAKLADPASWAYFGRANDYLAHGSAAQAWWGNLTNGKAGVVRWSWENGRLFQIPALFMLGMLAGRTGRFAASAANLRFWRVALGAAALLFVPLWLARNQLNNWVAAEGLRRPLEVMLASWSNLALMVVLVAGFTLLYQGGAGRRVLDVFRPLGRMSLTSYISQSVIGTSLYYGFGLGLYRYADTIACLAIGAALALLQIRFSSWWLARHSQGPLEALWHRATWFTPPRLRAYR